MGPIPFRGLHGSAVSARLRSDGAKQGRQTSKSVRVRLTGKLLPLCAAWAILLTGGPASALDPSRSIAQYKHTSWTVDDGAPPNIRALAQTSDGYLWLGTDSGLFRFDGVTFEPMSETGGDPSKELSVTGLEVSRSGDLWVGYASGRATVIRHGRHIDVSPPHLNGPIWKFAEDLDGGIWIVTGDRTYVAGRYAHGRWMRLDPKAWGLPDRGSRRILVGRDGTLWLSQQGRLFFLRRGAKRFEDTGEPPTFNPGLASDHEGHVWISDGPAGTRELPDYAHGRRSRPPTRIFPAVAKSGPDEILFDRDGSLWGTTASGGIFRIRAPRAIDRGQPGAEEVYTAQDGLSSDIATPILEDREGNIWVGTAVGLDRFRAANVVLERGITPGSRLGYVLFADRKGTIYAADSDTLYRVRPGGAPEVLLRNLDNPQSLCETHDGTIWLGLNNRILQFRHDRFSPAPPLPISASFLDCFEDRQGGLWFSLVTNGFLRLDGRGWHQFPIQRTGIDPTVILADRQGRLLVWVRQRGLLRIDHPHVRLLWNFKDMPGGNIHALYQGTGDVLIGSASGLARIHEGRIQILHATYPWLTGVTGLVETPQGETWVLASRAIARLSSRDLARAFEDSGHTLHPRIFDLKDGLLPVPPFFSKNSAVRGGDGRLWFVTGEGIVWIDPAHLARNVLPPPVSIRTLTANGQRYRAPDDLVLAKGVSSIEIDYAAPSLSIPERVRFRYKLDGVDPEWVDPGTRRQAFYTNLGPGRYRFHVIAANNDGVWNRAGATITITIPPTFLQSIWFKLLCALISGGVLWLAYSIRVRRVTAQLQAGLEVRLAERERIARELHDTLLQGFQGLVLRFQAIANRIPSDQSLRRLVDQALDRADAVLIDGRNRVSELRTATAAGDLEQALMAAASELTADPPARLNLTVEGRRRELHPIAREEIQRIGEEAIRNAFQHAGASRVEVMIAYHSGELRLDVRDDGVGLPGDVAATGERAGHFGLTGMRERADRIGGALTIVSRKGSGTEILLSIPGRAAYVAQRSRWSFALFRPAKPKD